MSRCVTAGSGNWGSAIATKIGQSVLKDSSFYPEIKMWVFEEYVKLENGKWVRPPRGSQPPDDKTWVDLGYRPLTEVINEKHENVVYLPGIPLPTSVVAEPDIAKAVKDATMMIFVIPHNFLAPIVPKMNGAFAKEAVGISLIKGIEFDDGMRSGRCHLRPPAELTPIYTALLHAPTPFLPRQAGSHL